MGLKIAFCNFQNWSSFSDCHLSNCVTYGGRFAGPAGEAAAVELPVEAPAGGAEDGPLGPVPAALVPGPANAGDEDGFEGDNAGPDFGGEEEGEPDDGLRDDNWAEGGPELGPCAEDGLDGLPLEGGPDELAPGEGL